MCQKYSGIAAIIIPRNYICHQQMQPNLNSRHLSCVTFIRSWPRLSTNVDGAMLVKSAEVMVAGCGGGNLPHHCCVNHVSPAHTGYLILSFHFISRCMADTPRTWEYLPKKKQPACGRTRVRSEYFPETIRSAPS